MTSNHEVLEFNFESVKPFFGFVNSILWYGNQFTFTTLGIIFNKLSSVDNKVNL